MSGTELTNPFGKEGVSRSPIEVLHDMEEDLEEFEEKTRLAAEKEEAERKSRLQEVQRRQRITDHIRDSHFGGFPGRHPDLDSSNESKLKDIVTYILDQKKARTPDEASTYFRNIVSQAQTKNIGQNHPIIDQAWLMIRTGYAL